MSLIETDCSSVAKNVNDHDLPAAEDSLLNDIGVLMQEVSDGSCCYVPRDCNAAAHTLAQYVFSLNVDCF